MRVASSDLVARPLDQREPFAVVDGIAEPALTSQEVDRDLLETLATQAAVEVLDPQLRRHPQRGLELGEDLLISIRLCLGMLG